MKSINAYLSRKAQAVEPGALVYCEDREEWRNENRGALADIFNSCCYSAMADVTKGDLERRLGVIASIANEAIGPLSDPFSEEKEQSR
jgi:hypothetical protein